MPDLELAGTRGPQSVFALLHDGRPVLLDLGEAAGLDSGAWGDRVQTVHARYEGTWELPAIGAVSAPTGVLIRPDGYVAWVGEGGADGLEDALGAWFGPATPSTTTSRPEGGS
jgi:3-(3-hydroxy-phenyl)propionate hydroxylase